METLCLDSKAYMRRNSRGLKHKVPTPSPLPLRVAKAGGNNLNEEITTLLPTGIGERCSQTISNLNLGHAALLRPCELPLYMYYKRKY